MTPPGAGSTVAVESTPEPVTTPPTAPLPRLENTARALLTGCVIGAVLAAGNVYTGLKSAFIDGGSITAALIGFAVFSTFRRLRVTPYGPLENNITQTTAASAAVMGFATGLSGPVPCLSMMGWSFSGWTIAIWGIAAGVIGVLAATLLRQKLVVDDGLPFPTGRATAEVIETIYTARATAIRRAMLLAAATLVAMAITWLREGHPRIIPQMTMLGGTLAGVAAGSFTLGLSWSPLMMSIGVMVGPRIAFSMLLGACLSWALLSPWLVRSGIVHEVSYGALSSWLVWPGLGLLVAGTLVPLLLDGGAVLRSIRDLFSFVARRPGVSAARVGGSRAGKLALGLLVAGTLLVLVLVGRSAFGLPPGVTVAALLLALVLASISGRSAGETDVGPVGAVGMLTQLAFSAYGALVMLVTGWVSLAASSQSAQTLWAFRAGKQLGASPRAQLGAQLLGMVVGAAVVVPVYDVIVRSYGIGTVNMPAPGALSWKATAEAMGGGLSVLPPHGPTAGLIALGVGILFTLLGKTRFGRYTPSPAAVGIAMLTSASLSFTAALGALVFLAVRRLRPSLDEPSVMAIAAGGIAGESVMGVIIAALIATGVLAG